ncbi:PP2C family protein-serine/threonine phosphatase [Mycoplasma putrefaciens]|uniref:Protein phosphatase n=1 Tax=Mycoplasma putrefaciens (strain ATCC 15718 / NCTC 10155 / C30 KS-1 / KS-1) TaxID=743965 RepID=A0A7U4E994_MYCPK|nr:protein phosphatase 2C domain-containing protein [Mycoplasma putrefaciens]AEM68607.1 protein phosphatase [Mycoplasma putrefaciens KS1]
MKIKVADLTHKGNYRKNNQDYLDHIKNSDGSFLAIICDGMGGHAKGEVASKITVDCFINSFKEQTFNDKTDKQILEWFKSAINYTLNTMNEYVKQDSQALDMGTTLSAIIFTNHKAYVVNVGDSRIYKLDQTNNLLKQITVDQNLMNSTYDLEQLKQQAQQFYGSRFNEITYWKILTSALGPNKKLKVDNYIVENNKGLFCLTSDGVYDYIDDQTLKEFLETKSSLKAKIKNITKFAMANLSTDNLSIILVEVK